MVDLDCSRVHVFTMVPFELDPLQGSRNFEDFQVEFCLEGAAFDKKRSGNIDKLSPVLELELLSRKPPRTHIIYLCEHTPNFYIFTGIVPHCAMYASKYVWKNLHLRA